MTPTLTPELVEAVATIRRCLIERLEKANTPNDLFRLGLPAELFHELFSFLDGAGSFVEVWVVDDHGPTAVPAKQGELAIHPSDRMVNLLSALVASNAVHPTGVLLSHGASQ